MLNQKVLLDNYSNIIAIADVPANTSHVHFAREVRWNKSRNTFFPRYLKTLRAVPASHILNQMSEDFVYKIPEAVFYRESALAPAFYAQH